MSEQDVPLIINGSKMYDVAHETAKFHRDVVKDAGDRSYAVILGAFFDALMEARRFCDRLGWEGIQTTGGWSNKPLTPAELEKQGDKPYAIATLTFRRSGDERQRTFSVEINSKLATRAYI